MTCKERILSNEYIDLIADYLTPLEYDYVVPEDYCFHNVLGELSIVYVNRSLLGNNGISTVNYTFLPKCYGLTQLTESIESTQESSANEIPFSASGITSIQNDPLRLTGRGVIIGFIDTGIQYQNDAFRNAFGESRILAIWDQTIQTGEPPQGFAYGTEYTKAEIDEALQSENPLERVPSQDTVGHGTAIASVAAGGSGRLSINEGFGQENRTALGAAPDCDMVVVKLKEAKEYYRNFYFIPKNVPCFQENDIILAIQYMQKFVRNLRRPLVIMLGIGTSNGDHSGESMLCRYMEYIGNQKSRAFITVAGNEGNHSHHYRGILNQQNRLDDVEIRVSDRCDGFVLDFWGALPYQFTASVRSPGGETAQLLQLRGSNWQKNQTLSYSFLFEGTTLYVDYFIVEQYSGSELIRFRFDKPVEGIWTIHVESAEQSPEKTFDMWLPISEFLSSSVVFLRPDPNTTITEPGYVHNSVCTATYQTGSNSIWQESGRGYARDGFVKPDLAAPGINITTAVGSRSGSSMAGAITAGAAAQLMQWAVVEQNDILADSNLVRNYLIRGASRDQNLVYPNRQWGYGRLNIEGVFRFLAGLA